MKRLFLIALVVLCVLPVSGAWAQNETVQQNQTAQALKFGPVTLTSDHNTGMTGLVTGTTVTATGGSTTTITSATTASVGQYVKFAAGTTTTALQNVATWVTAVSGTGPYTLTVSPALPASPANGDTYNLANLGVVILKNGGSAFVPPASVVLTDVGRGYYTLSGSGLSTDCNTLGWLSVGWNVYGATAGDSSETAINVVAYNPLDASLLGLTGVGTLANQTAQAATLSTLGTNTLSNGTAIAALPSASANASAVWGAGTKTITGGNVATVGGAGPACELEPGEH